MRGIIVLTLAAACAAGQASAGGSLTLSGTGDSEDGRDYSVGLNLTPFDNWSVGAEAGKSKSSVGGEDFAGKNLRLSTDVSFWGFDAAVSAQRWKDADQIKSTSFRGQFGWTASFGLGLSAIVDDHHLLLGYTARPLSAQPRPAQVDLNGVGVGAELSYEGEQWNASARYLHYSYGSRVDRLQRIENDPTTDKFPRLQLLLQSIGTRMAGAPGREMSASFGRTLTHTSLEGEWVMQRDAVTGTDINSLSAILGYQIGKHVEIDTTFGLSKGGVVNTVAFGGLSLTLRY